MSHIEHHHARYGFTGHIVYHEHAEAGPAESVRELVRPWTIRQWIAGGKMHREASPREVPRFELFFDLLYVAVIHQLAEAAIEEPGWPAVVRFVLTFWPSWSVWDEARKYANVSGTDDLLHRVWILVGMITILGYSASTSAISLVSEGHVYGADLQGVRWAAGFWLGIKLTRVLVLILYAIKLPLFRPSQLLAALAFLLPMLVYLPLLWVTNRGTQISLAAGGVVVDLMRVDLAVYWVMGRFGRWRLAGGHGGRRGAEGAVWGLDEGREGEGERAGLLSMPKLHEGLRIPAMNIEHAIERSSAFVVIVLGELVSVSRSCPLAYMAICGDHWFRAVGAGIDMLISSMNLLYKANEAETGLSSKFGKACLGLMLAWGLNYLYLLPDEPNAQYEHALRRSWLTGVFFTFLHFPLVACLILASAACGELMQSTPGASGEWAGVEAYWTAGLGGAVLCITLIDLMHRNLAQGQRVPRTARTAAGLAVGGLMMIDPMWYIQMDETRRALWLLAVGVAAVWGLVALGVLGSLPKDGSGAVRLPGPEGHEDERPDGVAAL